MCALYYPTTFLLSKKGEKTNTIVQMKIAVVGSLWLPTPPVKYGGTEHVIATLVDGLVAKGHDVTLFAPATAKTLGRLVPTVPYALRDKGISWENTSFTAFHLSEVFDRAHEFDIIHMHVNKNQDYLSFPLSLLANVPTLFTIHFRLPTPQYNPDRYRMLYKYRFLPYTSISNAQRNGNYLNFVATVYNSINPTDYPFVKTPENYVAWLGKITPVKGTRQAILAAQKAGKKLVLMGAIEKGVAQARRYFEEDIKPLIDGKHVIFYPDVGLSQKAKLLGNAQALVNPVQWEEPFGLVMIESQATGTPVIACKRGATEELVIDSKTGFLVKTIDQMAKRIQDIGNIQRIDCRQNVLDHFTPEKMIEGYEKAYEKTIANWDLYVASQNQAIQHARMI